MTQPEHDGIATDPQRVRVLLDELDRYRPARHRLLSFLRLADSNRDPLVEFCEHFVAALMGGRSADNRVQPEWDIELSDGSRAQVRYLANPGNRWVNEHHVKSVPGVQWYVLVLLEAFDVTGVIAFPPDLTVICASLGKRHGVQERTLQFTRRNWWTIRDDPDRFETLGTRVWLPPFE
jgi:hypothetical protein